MSNLIFTCAKNEGPFLLEWVAFHRALGFDRVLIFTNDCEDGTPGICDRLQQLGLVEHVRNEGPYKRGPQWDALNSAPLRKALRTAEWALHLDIDEFLNIKTRSGQLADLTGGMGEVDAISIPWRFFGNAGVTQFEDKPVLEQFTRCGPYPLMFPRNCLMFKTLFRPSERLDRAGVHAPRPSVGGLVWLNGDGRQLDHNFNPKRPILHGANAGINLAQINHYALKSKASFLVKSARGLPNHTDLSINLDYWVRRNFNDLEDRSLARRSASIDNPELQELHHSACAWHKAQAETALGTEAGVELYSAISVAGNTVAPTQEETRFIYQKLGDVYG